MSIVNAESATINNTFPSSEAWKEKSGRSTARREPRATEPKTITARIEAISSP